MYELAEAEGDGSKKESREEKKCFVGRSAIL